MNQSTGNNRRWTTTTNGRPLLLISNPKCFFHFIHFNFNVIIRLRIFKYWFCNKNILIYFIVLVFKIKITIYWFWKICFFCTQLKLFFINFDLQSPHLHLWEATFEQILLNFCLILLHWFSMALPSFNTLINIFPTDTVLK